MGMGDFHLEGQLRKPRIARGQNAIFRGAGVESTGLCPDPPQSGCYVGRKSSFAKNGTGTRPIPWQRGKDEIVSGEGMGEARAVGPWCTRPVCVRGGECETF